ncbi:MAG: hypothetical protein ACRDUV_03480 [Pseudonocardiaceae bacterium]
MGLVLGLPLQQAHLVVVALQVAFDGGEVTCTGRWSWLRSIPQKRDSPSIRAKVCGVTVAPS